MLKLCGLGILFCVCLYTGISLSAHYRKILAVYGALLALVSHIREQIEHFNAPLADIYRSFENPVLDECGFLFLLRTEGFSSAFAKLKSDFSLSQNVAAALDSFGCELGKSGRDGQISNCKLCMERLEREYNLYAESLPEKNKMCLTLSLMAGLCMVIVLY